MRLNGGMSDANLSKPVIDLAEIAASYEDAPIELTIVDLVEGSGAEATPGSTVDVHYVGVEYEEGEEFDSSWGRGEPATFPLGMLVKGWQEGIPGMKVGGRRALICPPHMAYGPAGAGHFLSGKTLIFVIDLLGIAG